MDRLGCSSDEEKLDEKKSAMQIHFSGDVGVDSDTMAQIYTGVAHLISATPDQRREACTVFRKILLTKMRQQNVFSTA